MGRGHVTHWVPPPRPRPHPRAAHLPGPAVGHRILPVHHPRLWFFWQHRGLAACATGCRSPQGAGTPKLGILEGFGDSLPLATSSRGTRSVSIVIPAQQGPTGRPPALNLPPYRGTPYPKDTPGKGQPAPSWVLPGGAGCLCGVGACRDPSLRSHGGGHPTGMAEGVPAPCVGHSGVPAPLGATQVWGPGVNH